MQLRLSRYPSIENITWMSKQENSFRFEGSRSCYKDSNPFFREAGENIMRRRTEQQRWSSLHGWAAWRGRLISQDMDSRRHNLDSDVTGTPATLLLLLRCWIFLKMQFDGVNVVRLFGPLTSPKLVYFVGSHVTVWRKKDLEGSNMWKSAPTGSRTLIQPAAGLHKGTGARRNVKAEDPLHLSTDPSPFHWTLKFALAIRPAGPSRPTRKNRAMIQVQKCRDGQTLRKIWSKNPKCCLKLLILCFSCNPFKLQIYLNFIQVFRCVCLMSRVYKAIIP